MYKSMKHSMVEHAGSIMCKKEQFVFHFLDISFQRLRFIPSCSGRVYEESRPIQCVNRSDQQKVPNNPLTRPCTCIWKYTCRGTNNHIKTNTTYCGIQLTGRATCPACTAPFVSHSLGRCSALNPLDVSP